MLFDVRRRSARTLMVLLVLGWLAACTPPGGPAQRDEPPVHTHLLIAGVMANGRTDDGSDQFVSLYNPLEHAIDLEGWSIGDGKVRATFPAGARIGPRQAVYAARDAEGFHKVMGAPSDYVWGPVPPAPPIQPLRGGATLVLGQANGTVQLRDGSGATVDALVYGAPPAIFVAGWKGPPIPTPQRNELLDRARDESDWSAETAGGYSRDTDSAQDWWQGREWFDLRVYRPGQTWFGSPTYTVPSVTLYASPDSSFETVTRLLEGARQSIDLNIYDFSSIPLAQELAAAASRGVRVRLLMEAGSFARLYDQERYVAQLIEEAGGEVRWMVHDPGRGVHGRYVFNHAKYAVIDGQTVFVHSENLVRPGVPQDPSYGNRGWGAAVEHRPLAAYLTRVFASDWNPLLGDTLPYRPGTPLGPPPPDFTPVTGVPSGSYPQPFTAVTIQGPVAVTPVLAPDHALLQTQGVIGLMRSARHSLYIEQQYAYRFWGEHTDNPALTPNLYLSEAIAAARRGVAVRILLGDAYLDERDPKDNTHTVKYLNELARRERLDLQARIVRSKLAGFLKVHNKGIIVDQRKVLVSSINWSRNSPAHNREVGLLLEHPLAGSYYTDIFKYGIEDTRGSRKGRFPRKRPEYFV